MAAYAMLDAHNGQTTTNYNIRLNRVASAALDGVQFVQVLKSMDYIVLKPATAGTPAITSRLSRQKSQIRITCNGYVVRGFLPKQWFGTGEKFKVKRSADGSLYICRKEVIEIGK